MEPLVSIKSISKYYGENVALNDISFDVPNQSIFGLLGPNGAGKTTLIRIINQIINADNGEILIGGDKLNPNHIKVIGYLPEERGLYKKMTVKDHLMYLAQLKGFTVPQAKEKILFWLKKFDILDWKDKKIEELSKGMAQKIQFIATVLHDPELIILDEPFSGFDPINADLIKNEILELRERGATIIFSTHRMESVEELCDFIGLINRSKLILSGSKSQIKKDFKTNVYEIIYSGNLKANGKFEIINDSFEGEKNKVHLKSLNGSGSNDMIKELIDQVEIIKFEEKIPTMNEIFIQQVKDQN